MPQTFTTELKLLASGIAMGESPRWHDGRLWFSDWGAQEILTIDANGNKELVLKVPFALPFSIDWLPNGQLLVVSGREGLLYRQEPDGSLAIHADLSSLAAGWNEIVVDGRGNAYINSAGAIALVTPDGQVQKVADGGAFPNGMAVTSDNATLILAESHGHCLTAFDIAADGTLSNRRLWADLAGHYPDGICLDAESAAWYADVPNKCCVRVREGGEVLQTVALDRGCFACMLGGANNQTLFLVANEWRGMDKIPETVLARTGQILAMDAPALGAGWP